MNPITFDDGKWPLVMRQRRLSQVNLVSHMFASSGCGQHLTRQGHLLTGRHTLRVPSYCFPQGAGRQPGTRLKDLLLDALKVFHYIAR